MSDIAISVNNVSKCFPIFDNQRSRLLHAVLPTHTKGMQEIWALKDINFEIKRGEAVAIIGRNGGGKSTLLEILTGTLTPTTGSVKVHGRVSALLELGSGFNPEYSGRDNVILNGLLLGLSKDDILSQFGEIEEFAEIDSAIDRPVKTYSSGMMMRLAFAVQVLCDPDILIIDEALSVGDFFFKQKCLSYIRSLSDQGVTLLFVSHDTGAVRNLCGRTLYLQRGRLVWDGEVNSGIQHYLNENQQPEKQKTQSNLQNHFSIANKPNQDALWRRPAREGCATQILAVSVENTDGRPIQEVRIGNRLRFVVWYQADELEPVHINITMKNRYDQVVNCTNSYNLGVSMPSSTLQEIVAYTIELDMNLEAGQYSVKVNLGRLGEKPNQGVVLDETTWFGPLEIKWNYLVDPAPFLGMFGIPARAIP